jgi:hypothetical protein
MSVVRDESFLCKRCSRTYNTNEHAAQSNIAACEYLAKNAPGTIRAHSGLAGFTLSVHEQSERALN